MPLSDEDIIQAVERYRRELDRYSKLADYVYEVCQRIVHQKLTIRASVQRRAKDPDSFHEKLKKADRRSRYNSVEDVFAKISDLAGVRVTTYVESDREKVVDELTKAFSGPNGPNVDIEKKDSGNSHYRATHCQVVLLDSDLASNNLSNLKGTTCEVQVCSLLAHVFNEIEHDLRYKPYSGTLSHSENSHLDQLGLLTQAGDISISLLLSENEKRLAENTGEFHDVHDFIARIRPKFQETNDFSRNAGQLFDELLWLKIDSPEKLVSELQLTGGYQARARSSLATFAEWLSRNNSTETLEADSSDNLLMLLLEQRSTEIVNSHPVGYGHGRPNRLVYFARRYDQMLGESRTT
jgi:ppGpp synthetase/RelA/SpoT-type nucleotidyltranferase